MPINNAREAAEMPCGSPPYGTVNSKGATVAVAQDPSLPSSSTPSSLLLKNLLQQQQQQNNPQNQPFPLRWVLAEEIKKTALLHFLTQLQELSLTERAAAQQALRDYARIVEHDAHPLAFLNAQDGNPALAAQRFAAYWQQRLSYGADNLKPNDAGNKKSSTNENKNPQLTELPFRDHAGRRLFQLQMDKNHPSSCLDMQTVFQLMSTHNVMEQQQQQQHSTLTGTAGAASDNHGSGEIILLLRYTVQSIEEPPPAHSDLLDMRLQLFMALAMPWKLHAIHLVVVVASMGAHPSQKQQGVASRFLLQQPILPSHWSSSSILSLPDWLPSLRAITKVHQLVIANMTSTASVPGNDDMIVRILKVCGISAETSSAATLSQIPTSSFANLGSEHSMGRSNDSLESNSHKISPRELKKYEENKVREQPEQSSHPYVSDTLKQELLCAMENLAEDTRAAYMEALKFAPDLIVRESNPTYFLEREGQDVWSAALRLAHYWQKRKELFQDRAFLPLDVTGNGALSESDIAVMATGIFVPLSCDDLGREMFCFDRSRFGGNNTLLQKPLLRSLFYWCLRIMDNKKTRSEGVVAIGIIRSFENDAGRLDAKQALDLLQDAFPIKMKCVYLCVESSSLSALGRLETAVVPQIVKRLMSYHSFECHVEIGATLVKIGSIRSHQLPVSAGGTWSYERFDEWFVNRRARERECSKRKRLDKMEELATMPTKVSRESSLASTTGIEWGSPSASGSSNVNAEANDGQSRVDDFTTQSGEGSFIETAAMQAGGLQRLEDAINDLPNEEKQPYLTANACVPFLVQLESNPLKFLRFEKYNAWAAAKRLSGYWKMRLEIFGSRAFLPLSLSGVGALTPEDVTSFHSSYICFLPKDERGRTVMCYDLGKRRNDSLETRMRLAFYAMSVVCENDLSVTEGYIPMLILGGRSKVKESSMDSGMASISDMVTNLFPCSVYRHHIVNCPTGIGQRIFFEVLLPVAFRLMGKYWNERYVILSGSKEQLFRKFLAIGLSPLCIPDSLGGTWTTQNHIDWIQERIRIENERYFSFASNILNPVSTSPEHIAEPCAPVQEQKKLTVPTCPILIPKSVGDDSTKPETKETVEKGLEELTKAIESIPKEAKAGYMRALAEAPELVQKESDPVAFLRAEAFDAVAAAWRLVKYWELRIKIFESRAFMALNQTAEGALDRRDLSILGTSYIMCLPMDSFGRAVIVCDSARLSKSTRESRQRVAFYIFSIASETKKSQTDGIVLLYVVGKPSFDRTNKDSLTLVLSAIPAAIHDVHLLKYPNDSEDGFSDEVDAVLLDEFRQVARNGVIAHTTPSRTSLAERLESYGLSRHDLPKSIGGSFGYDRFFQWQERRTRLEWDIPSGFSKTQDSHMFDFSKVTPVAELSEEAKLERRRRQNVIHSRRQRERERIEVEVLNEQCSELRENKKLLERENAKLLYLVHQAIALSKTCVSGD